MLVLLAVLSCRTEDESPMAPIQKRSAMYVDAETIPSVIGVLNETLNHRPGTINSANHGQGAYEIGAIDMEMIMEVVDTLDNANYTFFVEDGDDNLATFTNLVIRKLENGVIEPPYLLEYKANEETQEDFIMSGLDMTQFSGLVRKRYFNPNVVNDRSQANLDVRSNDSDTEPCDYNSDFSEGSTTGSPNTGSTGGSTGGGPSGGGWVETCSSWIEIQVVAYNCRKSDIGGNRCSYRTEYVNVTECDWNYEVLNVYDGTNCPEPTTGEVGVVPTYLDKAAMAWERGKVNLTDRFKAEECLMKVYNALTDASPDLYGSLKAFNSGDLKASLLFDVVEESGDPDFQEAFSEYGELPNAVHQFSLTPDGHILYVLIKLGKDYVNNATTIELVETLMHESIHAEITNIIYEEANNDVALLEEDFPKAFDIWKNGRRTGTEQHNLMAEEYIPKIVKAQKEFNKTALPDRPTPPDGYFEGNAWRGLHLTDAWEGLDTITQSRLVIGARNLKTEYELYDKTCD